MTENLIDDKDPIYGTDEVSEMKGQEKNKQAEYLNKIITYMRKLSAPSTVLNVISLVTYWVIIMILFLSGDRPNINYGSILYLSFPAATAILGMIVSLFAGKDDKTSKEESVPLKVLILIYNIFSIVALVVAFVYLIKVVYSIIQCIGIVTGSFVYTGADTNAIPWSDSTALCKNLSPLSFSLNIAVTILIASLLMIIIHAIVMAYLWSLTGIYATYLAAKYRLASKLGNVFNILKQKPNNAPMIEEMDDTPEEMDEEYDQRMIDDLDKYMMSVHGHKRHPTRELITYSDYKFEQHMNSLIR